MVVSGIDIKRCQRKDKKVVDGLCLAYNLLSGNCAASGRLCDAVTMAAEKSTGNYCDGMEKYRFRD